MAPPLAPMRHDPVTDSALAACASEPIHRLGRTQRFGVLLAFDRQRRVAFASANAAEWLGPGPDAIIGLRVDRLLPARSVDAAGAHARVAARRASPQQLYGVAWPGRDAAVDVSVHRSGDLVVLEAEPVGVESHAAAALAVGTRELVHSVSVEALAASAARTVAALTGYDRVMVYRLAADLSGVVIAEVRAARQASYLGLHYPGSDIPAQARELYLRNPTRVIVDADDEGLLLVGRGGGGLDLSLATLRSVSPVHLEYLRNMGTAASMSVSLVVDGRLWGLIACHHRKPMRPTLATRSMAELLGRLYSVALARAEQHTIDRDIEALLLRSPGIDPLVHPDAAPAAREAACATAGRLFGLSGLVLHADGVTTRWGQAPDDAAAAALARHFALGDGRHVVAVESLVALQPDLQRLAPAVAGLLALPLSRHWSNWVLLLRDEAIRHVTWAGNPRKPVDLATGRLTPRASFAAWREQLRGHCEPWSASQLELAELMRARLIEVMLSHHEQRELEQSHRSARQQALLVRELNHRVRNMLGLIKGLVHQTARGAGSVDELATRLHERVHALSRAYTQIEKARWQPAPLLGLIDEETRAFGEPGQVRLEGLPVDLEPTAYLAFALVVHELSTNARKYGALSVPEGRLSVQWRVAADGRLELDWVERGGPPVAEPGHRGFGSRVIAQALSHQLGGRATLAFEAGGVRARLSTPRGFVIGAPPPMPAVRRLPRQPASVARQRVLVVEDDIVIALTAEAMLHKLGCAKVVLVGSQADALQALRTQRFDFALLDVNLGDHDSGTVAARLAELGVPAIVASGYSDTDAVPDSLQGLQRIAKPYDEPELAHALAELGLGSG